MNVRKLWGIGPKTAERLKEMKITTVKQLSQTKQDKLIEEFGSWGHNMHLMSKGKDDSEVEENYEVKSIGRQTTFQEDTKDEKKIFGALEKLSERTHKELKESGFFYKTITITARFEDFDTHTSAKSTTVATDSLEKMKETAKSLMKKYLKDRRKIRLVGVRVSKLSEKESQKKLL